MAKRTPDRTKQAEQRAAGAARRAAVDRQRLADALVSAQARVNAAEAVVSAAIADRDQAMNALRALGESWHSLARLTGLSRQALMKRAAG